MMRTIAVACALFLFLACGTPEEGGPQTRSEPQEDENVPDEIVLVCDGDGHSISTEKVAPRPDGVRLVVDNRRKSDPGIAYGFADGTGGGDNAPPGRTVFRLPAPPGPLELACYPDDPNAEPDFLAAEVVDPQGLYVEAELDCERIVSTDGGSYAELPAGVDDPEAAARAQLDFGLEEGDELRRAGYPEAPTPVFVVVRDGEVVARTDLARGTKGWYAEGYEACDVFGG